MTKKTDYGRMIDADALMKALYHRAFETDGDTMWQSGCWVRYRAIEQVVKEQPTIGPERKTGEWEVAIGYDPKRKVMCTECRRMAYEPTPYCPNCGADMRGEQE